MPERCFDLGFRDIMKAQLREETEMATRRKPAEETPVSDFDFDAVQPVLAERPAATFKPNPLQKWLQASVDQGHVWLEITVPDDKAKDACNMLRRAALPKEKGGIDVGLQLSCPDPDGSGQVSISFRAKENKKSRKYTAEDVRAWATEKGVSKELLYPRIQRAVSRDYRIAMGYESEDK